MFGPRIHLFRVAGVAVKVDASWFVVAGLISWTVAEGLFARDHPDLTRARAWGMGLAAASGLFLSIVLHELGHALAGRRLSLPIRSITLFIFGGVAEMEGEPESPRAELLVALAGPAVTVALAVVCLGGAIAVGELGWAYASLLAWYLAVANLLLVVFNLVPAFPLDGGRVLRALLWSAMGDHRRATRVATLLGAAFGWVLVGAGVAIVAWTGSILAGVWTAVIGWFLHRAASLSWKRLLLRRALQGERVERFMHRDPISVPPSLSLSDLVEGYVYRYHHKMFPVLQGERLVGCVDTRRIRQVPREEWCRRSVASVLEAPSADNTFTPQTCALHALSCMTRDQGARFMVVEGERLVGIVSLRDLLRFLATKTELGAA